MWWVGGLVNWDTGEGGGRRGLCRSGSSGVGGGGGSGGGVGGTGRHLYVETDASFNKFGRRRLQTR